MKGEGVKWQEDVAQTRVHMIVRAVWQFDMCFMLVPFV